MGEEHRSSSGDGKNLDLRDIWKELMGINQTLTHFCKRVDVHETTLYGSPNNPQGGLVWLLAEQQKELSMIKKVAFALVPSTGIIWSVAEYLLRFAPR